MKTKTTQKTYRISDDGTSQEIQASDIADAVVRCMRTYDTGEMPAQEYCTIRVWDGAERVAEITVVADGHGGVADYWQKM